MVGDHVAQPGTYVPPKHGSPGAERSAYVTVVPYCESWPQCGLPHQGRVARRCCFPRPHTRTTQVLQCRAARESLFRESELDHQVIGQVLEHGP
jgi:hypothetical protein